MSCYVALDVETPNRFSDRMNAIDISAIENGIVADSYYSPVDPETHFDYFSVQLTGISAEGVRHAPTFPKVWEEVTPLIESGFLVAHNAVFGMGVLRKCLNAYRIAWKSEVPYLCTVQMGKCLLPDMGHKLDVLCEYYGIGLDRHKAGSDSHACAEILLRYLESGTNPRPFIRSYSLQFREIWRTMYTGRQMQNGSQNRAEPIIHKRRDQLT